VLIGCSTLCVTTSPRCSISLNAMTSYGHENLALAGHWKLMGAMEALNGWLLLGLTTAFLFGMIKKVKSSLGNGKHR
jgi:hypothetical protein